MTELLTTKSSTTNQAIDHTEQLTRIENKIDDIPTTTCSVNSERIENIEFQIDTLKSILMHIYKQLGDDEMFKWVLKITNTGTSNIQYQAISIPLFTPKSELIVKILNESGKQESLRTLAAAGVTSNTSTNLSDIFEHQDKSLASGKSLFVVYESGAITPISGFTKNNNLRYDLYVLKSGTTKFEPPADFVFIEGNLLSLPSLEAYSVNSNGDVNSSELNLYIDEGCIEQKTLQKISRYQKINTILDDNSTSYPTKFIFSNTSINTVKANNVVTVGEDAFRSCTNLTTVELPKLTHIQRQLFMQDENLTDVKFGQVTQVGYRAFYDCKNLQNFDFSHVITIEDEAFVDTKISEIKSNSVETVGMRAFNRYNTQPNKLLTTVELPNAKTIGAVAFAGNTNLSMVDISSAVTIGSNAFSSCSSLGEHSIKVSSDMLNTINSASGTTYAGVSKTCYYAQTGSADVVN